MSPLTVVASLAIIALSFTIIGFAVLYLRRVSRSLENIVYLMRNNGVNMETKNDLAKIAVEVAKTKDRLKKLEVSEEINKHKIDNLSKEVISYNPISHSKNLR